jgi:hypothetical protein
MKGTRGQSEPRRAAGPLPSIVHKEINVHFPRLPVAVAALSALCLTASAGVASAATAPSISPAPSRLTFVPPSVGPLVVSLGATIIDGQMISPGLNVSTTGTTLPPITFTPPSATTFPINGTPVH